MNKIPITDVDLNALKALDPILSKHIETVPKPVKYYAESFFICIVTTLIGQLISSKSAETIYNRLESLLEEVNVENFLAAAESEVIECGIYKKKYDQIYKIAKNLRSGILDFQDLVLKDDKEVEEILCQYPGVGKWSAEMIMIFGLKRKDIISFGDFGVRSGIKKVYNLDSLSKKEFKEIKSRLSLYGTIASLYFWQAHMKE